MHDDNCLVDFLSSNCNLHHRYKSLSISYALLCLGRVGICNTAAYAVE